jgi:hypothetical protein
MQYAPLFSRGTDRAWAQRGARDPTLVRSSLRSRGSPRDTARPWAAAAAEVQSFYHRTVTAMKLA